MGRTCTRIDDGKDGIDPNAVLISEVPLPGFDPTNLLTRYTTQETLAFIAISTIATST
jgi:hypothetical protein